MGFVFQNSKKLDDLQILMSHKYSFGKISI